VEGNTEGRTGIGEMKETLIGTVLGDGYLEPHGRGIRLQVNHSERFKAYVEWKRMEFLELRPSPLHRSDNDGYPFWRFVTRSHPYLAELRGMFYVSSTKIVPKTIGALLTHPKSLAVWFMDDGTCDRRQGSVLFETQSFGPDDIRRLKAVLHDNFGVLTTEHRSGVGRGLRLYASVKETRKLVKIIEPYVLPELRYKLPVPCND
jgi:LAGLIDADG DNA endonuclease family protein